MATQTYTQLAKQIQALQAQADAIHKTERASAIKSINDSIRLYAISAQELSFAEKPKAAAAAAPSGTAKYSDGAGRVWGGMGPRPAWLREAIQQGKSLADFLVGGKGAAKPAPKPAANKKSVGKPMYRDDAGHSWSGMGPKPRWLKEAIEAGKSLEDLKA